MIPAVKASLVRHEMPPPPFMKSQIRTVPTKRLYRMDHARGTVSNSSTASVAVGKKKKYQLMVLTYMASANVRNSCTMYNIVKHVRMTNAED